MAKVFLNKKKNFNHMLKQFLRQCKKENILADYRRHMFFIPKTEQRRRKLRQRNV